MNFGFAPESRHGPELSRQFVSKKRTTVTKDTVTNPESNSWYLVLGHQLRGPKMCITQHVFNLITVITVI